MKKNVSGQHISAQMITISDGSNFTGTVTVYITGDNGTQAIGSVGSGVCTHEGNGLHSYEPAQAESNYDYIDFTFIGTGAVTVTSHLYTQFPQTVDNNVLAAGATGFTAIDTVVDAIKVKTDFLPSATAGAAGGVFIAGTNAATIVTTSFTTTFTGNLTGSVDSVTNAITLPTIPANWITAAGINAGALNGKGDWNIGKTGYSLTITPAVPGDNMGLTAAAVDLIFDEVIAGHLTAGTAGLYLAIAGGILLDTSATGTPTTTTIDITGGVNTTDFYKDQLAWIISGTGVGQVKPVLSSSYSGGVTSLVIEEPYVITPVSGDRVVMQSAHVHPISQIQAGLATSVQVDDLAIIKNAAYPNFPFEMVLASDHVTPATGLTVTAQRLIDSGTYVAVAGSVVEVSNGTYLFSALAADTNGDNITWKFSAATADDTKVSFKTV